MSNRAPPAPVGRKAGNKRRLTREVRRHRECRKAEQKRIAGQPPPEGWRFVHGRWIDY